MLLDLGRGSERAASEIRLMFPALLLTEARPIPARELSGACFGSP